MNKTIILILSFLLLLTACTEQQPGLVPFLNAAQLPSQLITIDLGRDTNLVLQQGTHIFIPKGAIKSNQAKVQLEIKEALTPEQMLIAGLFTQSNGKTLSSGGMFYINPAKGEAATIVHPLKVSVPAKELTPGMQLFKGEETKKGINWKDPEPIVIPEDTMLVHGKRLFQDNCGSCHNPTKDATGPPLYGSIQHWGDVAHAKFEAYAFIRNPAKLISEGNPYANCLFEKWNKTAMPGFPGMSDDDLDAIYRYIDQEGKARLGADTVKYLAYSSDSCIERLRRMSSLFLQEQELLKTNTQFLTLNTAPTFAPEPKTDYIAVDTTSLAAASSRVLPEADISAYYNVEISGFGWYNIDILFEGINGVQQSELSVQLSGSYSKNMHVILLIPGHRVMVEGGKLNDGVSYGFGTPDGKLLLPQGVNAYLLAIGEDKDKAALYFGTQTFVTKGSQQITITANAADSAQIKEAIGKMNFPDLNISIGRKTNTTIILKEISGELDVLKDEMKKGGCNCYFDNPVRMLDSLRKF